MSVCAYEDGVSCSANALAELPWCAAHAHRCARFGCAQRVSYGTITCAEHREAPLSECAAPYHLGDDPNVAGGQPAIFYGCPTCREMRARSPGVSCETCQHRHRLGAARVEAVEHPPHYGGADNPYETIKVIEAWQLDFSLGNAVKYISRAGKKDSTKLVEDLKKARFYLTRAIERAERDADS